jgi:hypothetical protein
MTMRMTSIARERPYSDSATRAMGSVDSTTPNTGMNDVMSTRIDKAP